MNVPILGSGFNDACGAVLLLVIGGFLWSKADSKAGGILLLVGFAWIFMIFKYALTHAM